MKRRTFYPDILNHCYQQSADGGVIFYTLSDHLVYFTNYCILARKYNVRVLALCQMPDHVHDSVSARHLEDLVKFKRELNGCFTKAYREYTHTEGPVFKTPFGSSPKKGAKSARTNLIYVGNNPVERQLVTKAEDYRWNYLAYFLNPHPFSEPIVIRRASKALRTAIRAVRSQFQSGYPMNYVLLKNLTKDLNAVEIQQFTDYVISTYNVIDYLETIRYFDNFADMIISIHANTGSEYDLNEIFIGKTDKPYAQMTWILMQEAGFQDIHEMLSMPLEDKQELFRILRKRTNVMDAQIAKFLHLPLKRVIDKQRR